MELLAVDSSCLFYLAMQMLVRLEASIQELPLVLFHLNQLSVKVLFGFF